MIFSMVDLELSIQTPSVPADAALVFPCNLMAKSNPIIDSAISQEYEYGFVTDIEQETIPPGLNEDVIRLISSKKNEPDWLLEWRLKAYNQWLKMKEPNWAKLNYAEIYFQAIS